MAAIEGVDRAGTRQVAVSAGSAQRSTRLYFGGLGILRIGFLVGWWLVVSDPWGVVKGSRVKPRAPRIKSRADLAPTLRSAS